VGAVGFLAEWREFLQSGVRELLLACHGVLSSNWALSPGMCFQAPRSPGVSIPPARDRKASGQLGASTRVHPHEELVMELLEGDTLERRLLQAPLSVEQSVLYAIQIKTEISKSDPTVTRRAPGFIRTKIRTSSSHFSEYLPFRELPQIGLC
jgi:hypothetical protein